MIPSGRPSTSMVLITFKVLASHMVIGFVVENPWWDLGSTDSAAGFDAVNRAGRFQRIQIEDRQLPHRTAARDIQTTAFDVRGNIVKTAFAANFGCLQHLVRTCGWAALGQSHRTPTSRSLLQVQLLGKMVA